MNCDWKGVFPALTTPFCTDFQIDYEALSRQIDHQLKAGVHGLVLGGTLGEAGSLSNREKLGILRAALEAAPSRVPVLLGIAESSTQAACQLAKKAADAGAGGLMVLPPLQYASDSRESIAYFRAVADATELPIMIYNNPVTYGVDLTPEILLELADHPNFVAIKEASDDIRRITDIINLTGDRYRIFSGVDDLALESLMLGAVGWVAGLVCAFAQETVAIYDLAEAERYKEARDLYRWFMPLLHLDCSSKLVQNIKLAAHLNGLGSEIVRPPRLVLSGDERERVVALVRQALASRPLAKV